jgi:biopolymer transport protein ExbB
MKRNLLFQIGLIALAMAFVTLATGDIAWAQEGEAAGQPVTLWDTIKAGGAIGFIIIIFSVISIGMMIEFAVSLRRDKLMPPEIVAELEAAFDDEDIDGARSVCESERTPLTNLVLAALGKADDGYDSIREAAGEQAEEESLKLLQKISWLNLIGAIAPMMGLLGTVSGMICAFNVIATTGGQANAADLASGISQALITTVEGLIVALPAIIGYFYFKNKVARLIVEMGLTVGVFTDRFRAN